MVKIPKTNLADKLHHAFVWTCIGMTAIGFAGIVFRGFEYALYVRPLRKAEEARLQQQLLMEGQRLSDSNAQQFTN